MALGTAIAEVQQAGGGRTRVEGSGILLLRAMCRLTHMGHKEYAKGDGRRFNDYLEKEYPHLQSRCVGRAEMSKRQDWCTEVSWNFFNLIKPILTFTVSMCAMDANILRDAILIRLENIRFEAYVHVNAIMWKVAFAELRALTNRKAVAESGLGLNPLELNDLYDHLWNLGVLLKSDNWMSVLQPNFRPWPKVHEGDAVSNKFYSRLEKNKEHDMKELNDFTTRADVMRYTEELQIQLGLFGDGILTSLQRTMGKYLQNTLGELRNELKEDWMREEVAKLLCTNNPAERPFAVAKAFLNLYGRMKLSTLANFTLSVCNGSHRLSQPKGKTKKTQHRSTVQAGIAITSDPRLQAAVTRLCAVRQVNAGAITTLLKIANKRETQLANGLRIANEEQEKAKMAKKHTNKV